MYKETQEQQIKVIHYKRKGDSWYFELRRRLDHCDFTDNFPISIALEDLSSPEERSTVLIRGKSNKKDRQFRLRLSQICTEKGYGDEAWYVGDCISCCGSDNFPGIFIVLIDAAQYSITLHYCEPECPISDHITFCNKMIPHCDSVRMGILYKFSSRYLRK